MQEYQKTRPHARITNAEHLKFERRAKKNDYEIQPIQELYYLNDLLLKARMITLSESRVLTIIIKRTGYDNDLYGGLFFARNSHIAREAALSDDSCASRLLRGLRDKGIITAIDSPNCSRGDQNFGYSLNICHARFDELKQAANDELQDYDRLRLLRKQYQTFKKRIPAMLQLEQFHSFKELLLSQWEEAIELVEATKKKLKKVSSQVYMKAITILQMAIDKVNWEADKELDKEDMSCGHDNSPIRNTNTTFNPSVYCNNERHSANAEHSDFNDTANRGEALKYDKREKFEDTSEHIDLGMVFTACPALKEISGDYIKSWKDFANNNERIAIYLGISPDLMNRAKSILPQEFIGVALAVVLQKTNEGEINSQGGYFKGMIDKAAKGELHLAPTIHGLLHKTLMRSHNGSSQTAH